MPDLRIVDVTKDRIADLCRICISTSVLDDPVYAEGIRKKTDWATRQLAKWGSFAKLAYLDDELAGMIQYEPIPDEEVVSIQCIWVPDEKHWKKGIATALLESLRECISCFWVLSLPALPWISRKSCKSFEKGRSQDPNQFY